jgi:hypothetical protein
MRLFPASLLAALAVLAAALLAAPAPALALGDGDGFVATLWGEPAEADLEESVRLAADAGARHVTFLVFLHQDGPRASDVRFQGYDASKDFEDTAMAPKLRRAALLARGRGLSVGMIPFPFEPGRSKRHFWNPTDRAQWFRTYGARLADLARFCEREGFDQLVAGSELSLLFQYTSRWRQVVAGIRREYSGHVTISSTWPDYPFIRFWDALDSIGVSGYFPLALSPRTTSARALEAAWRVHKSHLLWYARAWRKPLTFVEVGYPATPVAATRPWDYDWSRPYEPSRQALCFEAFRRVWGSDARLRRFQVWGLSPLDMDRRDTGLRGFLPLGKPADPVVRALFAERAR